ncbi:ATP-binding protein [Oceaniglobus indicus]|uniref:ATP-binding protein n=1 Tax=Oceaniglobus indicus TaxID=2047749 RepID=UPI000C183FB1|nr:ATP-binding protein [Oceaniglobus indicus]
MTDRTVQVKDDTITACDNAMGLDALLAAADPRLRSLLETLPIWFWSTGRDHRLNDISRGLFKATGMTPDSYLGASRLSLCDGRIAQTPEADEHRRAILAHEAFRGFTYRHVFGDDLHWVTSGGDAIFGPGGDYLGHQGAAMAVSSSILNAGEVARSEERLLRRSVELERAVDARTDALDRSYLLLAEVLEAMDQGLLVYDTQPDGQNDIVLCNARCARLMDLPPDLCQPGANLTEMLRHCVRRGDFRNQDQGLRALRLAARDSVPFLLTPGDGQRHIRLAVMPTSFGGGVVTFTDVTTIERRKRSVEEARIAAIDASHAKSAFLAAMSHEIRTPMNGIIGMAELLCDSDLDPKSALFARTILESGAALLDVIGDVLDFSKIEAGKMTLNMAPVDIAALSSEVCALLQPRADAAGLRLTRDLAPDLPVWWCGDATRLRQILLNLIGNAIKFTHEGHIVLRLRSEAAGGLRIEVEDSGIGIPPDKLNLIFDAFEQVDHLGDRQYEGTGLGLAITRRLVTLMGGALGARSTVGEGTLFSVDLPLLRVHPADVPQGAVPDRASEARVHLRGKNILVAEDNRTNQLVIRHMLTPLGAILRFATDGVEAVAAFTATRPDLVIMDMSMPRLSGTDAAREMRRIETGARCPILALTGNALAQDRADCLAAGMDGFLSKPVRKAALFGEIARIMPDDGQTGARCGRGGRSS